MFNRSDLQDWQDMWNKAQDELPKPQTAPEPPEERLVQNSSIDKEYWDQVYKASLSGHGDADVMQVFTEKSEDLNVQMPVPVKPNQSKEELGNVAKTKANAANPIDPASIGKDQDYKPNLADAHQLEQLHNLKINLYELECKLNVNDCLAKTDKGKKIQNQIKALKTHIDELSDNITPDFLQSYLS